MKGTRRILNGQMLVAAGVAALMTTHVVCAAERWPAVHGKEIWKFEPAKPICQVDGYDTPEGFHGRVVGLARITGANARGDESVKTWRASAWRNEFVHGQFVVWTGRPAPNLRAELAPFVSADGATLPQAAAFTRFVRYTFGSTVNWKDECIMPPHFVGDCLDPVERLDLPRNGFRPVWLTVRPPQDAKPGVYRSRLTLRADGGLKIEFPLELTVGTHVLPNPAAWQFHADLWQHPWAIARYHGVTPFSPAHYQLMRPYCEALAQLAVRTITCTLVDMPWNHQSYDAYHSMIRHVRQPDGSWTRDYSILDSYVAFARSCGLGPQIHCYSMVPWGNIVTYEDAASGDTRQETLVAGTPEHAAFWGPLLEDLSRHMAEKGWADDTYIAMDERSPEELRAAFALIRQKAPRFKIQSALNRMPSAFGDLKIDSSCHYVAKLPEDFRGETAARRAAGLITTFYVCCCPDRPNTFLTSPLHESRWPGLYAARGGFNGFARWAAYNWPADPFRDTSFGGDDGNWLPGDPFLLYPGPRLSTRWEMLRDSFENYEKIRILRDKGASTPALEHALEGVDFAKLVTASDAAMQAAIEAVEKALEDAAF